MTWNLGITNVLALPFAASYEVDDGETTLSFFAGPFFLALSWSASL